MTVSEIPRWLERKGTKKNRDGMARYGIVPEGVRRHDADLHSSRHAGRDHELAAALWDTGWYEARMLAAFVDEPARVTAAQMDRWCRDFDNWAICDTCASSCSTARRTLGRRSTQWSDAATRSSSSARRSRCWRASRFTTKGAGSNRGSR